EVDIQDLKKKVEHLEYDRIQGIEKDINQLKIDFTENNVLTKQMVDTNEKLSSTMSVMQTTMVELAQSVKDSNKISSELTKTVEGLNNKITQVDKTTNDRFQIMENKIDDIDDKSKIDIVAWLKNNWFGTVMGIGAIVYAVSQFIK
ncbi:MAG: hypothetical protein KBT03_06535, partial [Bacteroidales bacterium]|nr:hypothetical protein [Candidatus Scybalousia scybalohippi]